jgi:hypothetical protein
MCYRPTWRAVRPACLLVACALLALGCGGPKRKPVFTTEGKILQANGSPAVNVTVFLHPPASDPDPLRPLGVTDESGTFKLTTYDANDGAPAGEYVVTLMYEPLDSPLFRKKVKKPDIPAAYTKPDTSPLRAKVEARPGNVLEPIKLP